MAKKGRKKKGNKTQKESDNDASKEYIRDFMALRNAIIENCRDCIRDCGKDCLDDCAKPIENIRCPLQKVRMDYGITIKGKGSNLTRLRKAVFSEINLE